MNIQILLKDTDQIQSRPLSRLKTVFSFRNGIYNTIERLKHEYHNPELFFYHPNQRYEELVSEIDGLKSVTRNLGNNRWTKYDFYKVITSTKLKPISIVKMINSNINKDLEYFKKDKDNGELNVFGDNKNLYISRTAKIKKGVIFDTSDGVIVIDERSKISPHSYLKGPLYIGKDCQIDNARIYGGTIIGHQCRIGGEIENSIFNDFTNKHHDGFVGHSVIGSWVNFGAMATTSDLKNNYHKIRLELPFDFIPTERRITIETKEIKFGSIIGDCTKIAIGKMINSGTVIDFGCNLFNDTIEKYMPPLSWGEAENRYRKEDFIEDCKTIFNRRNQVPHENYAALYDLFTSGLNKNYPVA